MRLFLQTEITGRHVGRILGFLAQLALVVLLVYAVAGIGYAIATAVLVMLILRGLHAIARGQE